MAFSSAAPTIPALPRIYAWFSAMILDDLTLMQDLLNHGLPVDVPHPLRHTTALMEATRLGRTNMVEWLLHHGAAPALLNGLPQGTALHCALRCRQWDIAEMLINAGDTPGVTDAYGRTPLHMACMDTIEPNETAAAMDIIHLLIGKACPLDALDKEGVSALHYTVLNDNRQLTELLLVHGANPNVQTPDTLTSPLMIAATEKSTAIASVLLHHGADPHLRNKEGASAILMLPTISRLLGEHAAGNPLRDMPLSDSVAPRRIG